MKKLYAHSRINDGKKENILLLSKVNMN